MTLRKLLALFMAASLVFVGPVVMADDDDDSDSEDSAPAMQVRTDKKTGNKIAAEDDAGNAPSMTMSSSSAARSSSSISAMIPAKSEPPQYHADGSVSVRVGMESLKYLVVTKDENGENVITHVPASQLDAEVLTAPTDSEEQ